jgi:DNA polymerase III psi subunit
MTEKYLLLNDEIYIFHPDTHEVFRVNPERIERFDHSEAMMALRLSATEITRRQAEHAVPTLEGLHDHFS